MESSKIAEKNALWCAVNFKFPELQTDTYVPKSDAFKIFVDEELVGEVNKEGQKSYMSNLKFGCKIDIVKGNIPKQKVYSTFSFIVGEEYAKLYISQDTWKKVKLNFDNRNLVEVYDERDFDSIDENGLFIT